MANQETPYLKLPYNEGDDKLFREQYNMSMDLIDKHIVKEFALDGQKGTDALKYPVIRESIFDDNFFAVSSDFNLRKGFNRYFKAGQHVFFEVQTTNKKAIVVPPNGNITNLVMGSVSNRFVRRFGEVLYSINYTAASYGWSTNSIRVAGFGGMSAGTTIPANSNFAVAGWFTT